MSFFGLTLLGDQNPFRDRMLPSTWRKAQEDSRWDKLPELPPVGSPRRLVCTDTCSIYNQPVPFSADVRQGIQARNKEEMRWAKTPRSPNQLYCVPFTENQKYGWCLSTGEPQTHDSWIKVRRFPRKNSEMTKFVKEMSMTNREFSLF